jgi:hypothetical protein
VLLMLGFLAATNYWVGWKEGIRLTDHLDVYSYELIAAAAPESSTRGIGSAYTERVASPWLAGTVGDLLGVSYRDVFRVLVATAVGIIAFLLGSICARLRLSTPLTLLCLGVLILNPYMFRFYGLAPGSVPDLTFVLGLALLLYGLVADRLYLVLAGGVIAVLGRQTALLVAPAALAWLWTARDWRKRTRLDRLLASVLLLGLVAGTYAAVKAAVAPFTYPYGHSIPESTVLPGLGQPASFTQLMVHLVQVALPLIVVSGCLLGALAALRRLAGRVRPPAEFWCAVLIAAAIVVQPLAISPTASDFAGNEQRLSVLALFPLCVALVYVLQQVERVVPWRKASPWALASALVALLVASLHRRYSPLAPENLVEFVHFSLAPPLQILAGGVLALLVATWYGPRLRHSERVAG